MMMMIVMAKTYIVLSFSTIIVAFYMLTHLILKINLSIKGTVFNPSLTNRATKRLSNLFQSHSTNKRKVRI